MSQTELLKTLATHSVRTARRARQLPRRLIVAIVLTVGAVVLLGATSGIGDSDDAAPATDPGATCPWLNTRVTGLTATQERNAKIITVVAQAHDVGETGAVIGVAAALAESNLLNLANDGTSTLYGSLEGRQLTDTERAVAKRSLGFPHDGVGNNLDSIGLFQQRPMSGWGPPETLIDPAKSAGLFFDELVQLPDWRSNPPWETAQTVQGSPSADGEIYRDFYGRAEGIVADVTAAPSAGSALAPQEAAAIVGGGCSTPALRRPSGAFTVPVPGLGGSGVASW